MTYSDNTQRAMKQIQAAHTQRTHSSNRTHRFIGYREQLNYARD